MAAAAVLTLAVVAGLARWRPRDAAEASASPASTALARVDRRVDASNLPPEAPSGVATAQSAAAPLAAVDRLWTTGSLRGTQLDGDWGRWAGGVLQPSRSLRRRFDQLLSTQGEVPLASLRLWVDAQVRAEQGDAGVRQVLDVWDRYVELQQTPFSRQVDVADPSTWQPALAEHSLLRRRLLGSAWAEAFYGDEEREVAAFAAAQQARGTGANRASTSTPTDAPVGAAERALQPAAADLPADRLQADRTARFGAEAAARLQANDTAWADWDRRIQAARAEWAALAAAPQLSEAQRSIAQQRLLAERFTADELPRARALVQAPS